MAHLHGNLEAGEEPKVTLATVLAGSERGLPATTHLSVLWGLNLAPPQGRAPLASFLSEEGKSENVHCRPPPPVQVSFSLAER